MWVWDAGAPQLTIGVSRTGNLPHYLIAYLFYTFAFPLCCFTHIRSRSAWLRVVKRVPCHVLETRKPHVMDGRVVSRGPSASRSATPSRNLASLPWTLPQHQYLPRSALKHTLPLRHPLSTTSWSFHPFYAITAYLGMIMPFLVLSLSRFAILILYATTLIIRELVPCKCLISASPLSAHELDLWRP
jgi:hypothetical protein